MKKKLLIALPVCILFVVLAFLSFYKGEDTLTYFQRKQAIKMFSSVSFFDEQTGEFINTFTVAAANDSTGAENNTFLWYLNRYDSSAGYVQLNVAFGSDGIPYLAESYDGVTQDSVKLERVFMHITGQDDEEAGLVLNLCEYTSLDILAANIEQFGLQKRTFITGVDEKSLPVVKRYFSKTNVLCTYNSDTVSSLEELAQAGADGIICEPDELTDSLVAKAKELDLLVWADCADELYGTVKAMSFGIDGVISSVPEMVVFIYEAWCSNVPGKDILTDIAAMFYSE